MSRKSLFAAIVPAVLLALAAPARAGESGEALRKMEDSVKKLVEKVTPSVVAVEMVGADFEGPAPKAGTIDVLIRRKLLQNAGGSGFAVSADTVVTSARAVPKGIKTARVVLTTGDYRKAKVLGRSDDDDVVLLEVEGGGLTPVEFAPAPPSKGEFVMTVGNAFAVMSRMWRHAYSMGVVSGFYEVKQGFNFYYSGDVIETDAAVNPGNFGGPLFDRKGRVVGMVVSSFAFRRWLGCAVPAARVLKAVAKITGAEPETPVSGSSFEIETLGAAFEQSPAGWTVKSVKSGGIAAVIGLSAGDVVVAVNGAAPAGAEAAAKAFAPGSKVTLKVDKKGFTVTYEFSLPAEKTPEDEDEF